MRTRTLLFILLLLYCANEFTHENFWLKKHIFQQQQETLSQKIRQSDDIEEVTNYQFTPQNVADFKFFFQQTIDILEGKNIYAVLSQLDYHFNGGEHLPKKLFAPITRGFLFYHYLFREPTPTARGVYGIYMSHFKRKDKPYWVVSIISLNAYANTTSVFNTQDFEEFQLHFKEKLYLKDLAPQAWLRYSSTQYSDKDLQTAEVFKSIEDKCYAIYRFERQNEKAHLQVDFCVSRGNYHAADLYPYRFSWIVIDRLDSPPIQEK